MGSVAVSRLAMRHGSVAAAWDAYPSRSSRSGGEVDVAKEFAAARRFGVEILTPCDEDYPKRLKETPGHPLALYVKGDAKALSAPSVAVVGTRRATQYGLDQADRFARGLCEAGWAVASGLALGIDAAAHRGALAAGGKTFGILGSALDRFYPEENRALAREIVAAGGAVASEFPFGRNPDQQTFPQRNRIVAALSSGVLCVEAPRKSGTMITASFAADMGRTVMAVPGRADSRSSAGCLALIRDGARLVRSPEDALEDLGSLIPAHSARRTPGGGDGGAADGRGAPPPAPFSLEESMVMRHVDAEGVPLDLLVAKTGLSAARVNSVCMALRLKGRLRFFPGNRVALPRED